VTILVDTSFLFALANKDDSDHAACLEVAGAISGRVILPVTVLPEVGYLLAERIGHHAMRQVFRQLLSSTWIIEPLLPEDFERTVAILEQYTDARLDFVDATLIAIAERLNITTLLTLDRRDFSIVQPQHCRAFDLQPFRP